MKTAHTLSIVAAALGAGVIATGAYITSAEVVARLAQATTEPNQITHQVSGFVLILVAIGLAIACRSWAARALAWSGAALLSMLAASGWPGAPLSPGLGVLHALLSHLYFAMAVATALVTSEHWNRPAESADVRKPFLRPLALATPPVVLTQIALGALYRHNVIGIILHVAVAMIVALFALILCSIVLQNYTRPASLKRAAGTLMGAVLLQVSLGIASLVMLLLNFTATNYFIAATVAHVLIGASTLAASVVMAIEVWRSAA
jgi:hypothetical protein